MWNNGKKKFDLPSKRCLSSMPQLTGQCFQTGIKGVIPKLNNSPIFDMGEI